MIRCPDNQINASFIDISRVIVHAFTAVFHLPFKEMQRKALRELLTFCNFNNQDCFLQDESTLDKIISQDDRRCTKFTPSKF